jgi:hypothetical protein
VISSSGDDPFQVKLLCTQRQTMSNIVNAADQPTWVFIFDHALSLNSLIQAMGGFFNFSILTARQPAGMHCGKALMLRVMVPRIVFP